MSKPRLKPNPGAGDTIINQCLGLPQVLVRHLGGGVLVKESGLVQRYLESLVTGLTWRAYRHNWTDLT